MANYYGSIDLTELGNIIKQHPSIVREVQMKDGSTHKFVPIDIWDKGQPDQYGNAASMKVSVKKEERKEGVKYYISNLKQSKYEQQPQAPSVLQEAPKPQQQQPTEDLGLPF